MSARAIATRCFLASADLIRSFVGQLRHLNELEHAFYFNLDHAFDAWRCVNRMRYFPKGLDEEKARNSERRHYRSLVEEVGDVDAIEENLA